MFWDHDAAWYVLGLRMLYGNKLFCYHVASLHDPKKVVVADPELLKHLTENLIINNINLRLLDSIGQGDEISLYLTTVVSLLVGVCPCNSHSRRVWAGLQRSLVC